jgi:fructosamine-3-kinase
MSFIEKELIELDICKTILEKKSIGGGCINNASRYTTDKGNFFVKVIYIDYIRIHRASIYIFISKK